MAWRLGSSASAVARLRAELPGLTRAEREHSLAVARAAERRHSALAAMDTSDRYEALRRFRAAR